MKTKYSFTKSEMIALEMLIQQYAKSNGRKKILIRDQMKLLGFHVPKQKKQKPITVEEFRKLVQVTNEPMTLKPPTNCTTTISISSIIKEFIVDYKTELMISEFSINFNSDLMLQLAKLGFEGFIKLREIEQLFSTIPSSPGVFIVFNFSTSQIGISKPKTVEKLAESMKNKWVEEAKIVYIGAASDQMERCRLSDCISNLILETNNAILCDDITILQSIPNYNQLLVCWKEVTYECPLQLQKNLLLEFKNYYSKLPFANT